MLADLSAERIARRAAEAGLRDKVLEAEHLRAQLARLRRMQFGQSSERLRDQIAQLELALEELEAEPAEVEAAGTDTLDKLTTTERSRRGRKPRPEHLPRREVEHRPDACACTRCGGMLRQAGTDVTEVPEYVPGRFEVIRHVRPAFSRRSCEMCQAPMPSLPIDWFSATLRRLPGKSALAGAIRYSLGRWEALSLPLRDGRARLDNNSAERAIRPVALGRKNYLFAGSDSGASAPP